MSDGDPNAILEGREIIVEITILGDFARGCAVDAETGVEAVVIAPANAARRDIERLATSKLAHVMYRRKKAADRKDRPPNQGFIA